mgnify:CR=1 FL=1
MQETTEAFWAVAPGCGEIRRDPLPTPAPDEVAVETLYSGVSRGTESLVFAGKVPSSQYRTMRAPFQAGDFPFPVKYGYAAVGRVTAGAAGLLGRLVFCLHPHQRRFVVRAGAVTVLPEGLPPRRAVLAANAETALNALWDAPPLLGDRIAVIGAGTVGCLIARLAAGVPGARVTLVDSDPGKARIAAALHLPFATPEDAPGDCELVVEATGNPAALAAALPLAATEGTILAVSWYGDRPVTLPLGEAFHSRRLRIISSQVGLVSHRRRDRHSHSDRMALALRLLTDPLFDRLIDGESEFADLPRTLPALAEGGALCHVVRY